MSHLIRCEKSCDGWDVFEITPNRAEIQRCDDCDRFPSDDEARRYVGAQLLLLNESQSIVELLREAADAAEKPCYRDDFDGETWQCVNDHTGCIWNDGNNGCNAPGVKDSPLEEFEADQC